MILALSNMSYDYYRSFDGKSLSLSLSQYDSILRLRPRQCHRYHGSSEHLMLVQLDACMNSEASLPYYEQEINLLSATEHARQMFGAV